MHKGIVKGGNTDRFERQKSEVEAMWFLFAAGVFLAVAIGLFVDPTKVPWRAVEVTSIALGSLAIVSAIAEWRRIRPANESPHLKRRVFNSLSTLSSVASTYLAIVRSRIENKSSNLDQYTSTLPWFESVAEFATADVNAEPSSSSEKLPNFPPDIDDGEIVALKHEIDTILEIYEKSLTGYKAAATQLDRTSVEELATFAMPFLFIAAVSLSLFKALYQP